MPKKYENKSNHNKDFLDSIHNDYPNSYFDWKVTIQFYTALHKCYCVIISSGSTINTSHKLNIESIRKIDLELSQKLFKLYNNSRQSRYDGFMTEEAMNRFNKINFLAGEVYLKNVENLTSRYYPIQATI